MSEWRRIITHKALFENWEPTMSNPTLPSITLRAYQLWEAAGRPKGRDEEFYFQAEEELRKLLQLESTRSAEDE